MMKMQRERLLLTRARHDCDISLVCRNGVTYGHQLILSQHSQFLRSLFEEQSVLTGVSVEIPSVEGFPPIVNLVRTNVTPIVLHLPDLLVEDVSCLLDVLYTGDSGPLGGGAVGAERLWRVYKILCLDENGGLPLPQKWAKISQVERGPTGRNRTKSSRCLISSSTDHVNHHRTVVTATPKPESPDSCCHLAEALSHSNPSDSQSVVMDMGSGRDLFVAQQVNIAGRNISSERVDLSAYVDDPHICVDSKKKSRHPSPDVHSILSHTNHGQLSGRQGKVAERNLSHRSLADGISSKQIGIQSSIVMTDSSASTGLAFTSQTCSIDAPLHGEKLVSPGHSFIKSRQILPYFAPHKVISLSSARQREAASPTTAQRKRSRQHLDDFTEPGTSAKMTRVENWLSSGSRERPDVPPLSQDTDTGTQRLSPPPLDDISSDGDDSRVMLCCPSKNHSPEAMFNPSRDYSSEAATNQATLQASLRPVMVRLKRMDMSKYPGYEQSSVPKPKLLSTIFGPRKRGERLNSDWERIRQESGGSSDSDRVRFETGESSDSERARQETGESSVRERIRQESGDSIDVEIMEVDSSTGQQCINLESVQPKPAGRCLAERSREHSPSSIVEHDLIEASDSSLPELEDSWSNQPNPSGRGNPESVHCAARSHAAIVARFSTGHTASELCPNPVFSAGPSAQTSADPSHSGKATELICVSPALQLQLDSVCAALLLSPASSPEPEGLAVSPVILPRLPLSSDEPPPSPAIPDLALRASCGHNNSTLTTVSTAPAGDGGDEISTPVEDSGILSSKPLGDCGVEISKPLGDGGVEISKPLGDDGVEISKPLVDSGIEISKPIGIAGVKISLPMRDSAVDISKPSGDSIVEISKVSGDAEVRISEEKRDSGVEISNSRRDVVVDISKVNTGSGIEISKSSPSVEISKTKGDTGIKISKFIEVSVVEPAKCGDMRTVRRQSGQRPKSGTPGKYACPFCELNFKQEKELQRHDCFLVASGGSSSCQSSSKEKSASGEDVRVASEKKTRKTAAEFQCPFKKCDKSKKRIDRENQKDVLAHFIGHHLRRGSMTIYADFDDVHEHRCRHCFVQEKSTERMLAHMAVEHGDLDARIEMTLSSVKITKEEARACEIVKNYLRKKAGGASAGGLPSTFSSSQTSEESSASQSQTSTPSGEEQLAASSTTSHSRSAATLVPTGARHLDHGQLFPQEEAASKSRRSSPSPPQPASTKVVFCQLCPNKGVKKGRLELMRHFLLRHMGRQSGAGTGTVDGKPSCSIDNCGKSLSSVSKLHEHILQAHEEALDILMGKSVKHKPAKSLVGEKRLKFAGVEKSRTPPAKLEVVISKKKKNQPHPPSDLPADELFGTPDIIRTQQPAASTALRKSVHTPPKGVTESTLPLSALEGKKPLSYKEDLTAKQQDRQTSVPQGAWSPADIERPLIDCSPGGSAIFPARSSSKERSHSPCLVPSGTESRASSSNLLATHPNVPVLAASMAPSENTSTSKDKEQVTQLLQCRHCAYKYTGDWMELKHHILLDHAKNYVDIQELQCGVKQYECQHCKSFRSKTKNSLAVHMLKSHSMVSLLLVESQTAWTEGLLKPTVFCRIVEKESSYSPEIIDVPDNDSVGTVELDSSEEHEEVEKEMTSSSVCSLCDRDFSLDGEAAAHMLFVHLVAMRHVWRNLLALSESGCYMCSTCRLSCSEARDIVVHIYNNHRAELKAVVAEDTDLGVLLDAFRSSVDPHHVDSLDELGLGWLEEELESSKQRRRTPSQPDKLPEFSLQDISTEETTDRSNILAKPQTEIFADSVAILSPNIQADLSPDANVKPSSLPDNLSEPSLDDRVKPLSEASGDISTLSSMVYRPEPSPDNSEEPSPVVDAKMLPDTFAEISCNIPAQLKDPEPTADRAKEVLKPSVKCEECGKDMDGLHELAVHVFEHSFHLGARMVQELVPELMSQIVKETVPLEEGELPTYEWKRLALPSGQQDLFVCSACEFSAPTEKLINDHSLLHQREEDCQSACSICGDLFSDYRGLMDHKHNRLCPLIKYRDWLQRLCWLAAACKETDKQKNPACGTVTVKLEPFDGPPPPTYKCTHQRNGCEEIFSDKVELHRHARHCPRRPRGSGFSCLNCRNKYYYEDDFEKHLSRKCGRK